MESSFKKDLLAILRREIEGYTYSGPAPFLCTFLEKTKAFSANSPYARIAQAAALYEEGGASPLGFLGALLDVCLCGKLSIGLDVYSAAQRAAGRLLTCAGLDALPENGPGSDVRYARYAGRLRAMQDGLEARKDRVPARISDGPLDMALYDLADALRKRALVFEAKAWLYDEEAARKKDRSMRLIDEYFKRSDAAYYLEKYRPEDSLSAAAPSPKKRGEIRKLYALMDKDTAYDQALLPVWTDPDKGLGLYIFGTHSDNARYPVHGNDRRLRKMFEEHRCVYSIFCIGDVHRSRGESADYMLPGYLLFERLDDHVMLDEAIASFQAFAEDDTIGFGSFNGAPPEGCPESLLAYFEYDEDLSDAYQQEEAALRLEKRGRIAEISSEISL